MVNVQAATLRGLLQADDSPFRGELIGLLFDAVSAEPVARFLDRGALSEALYRALLSTHTERIATRHVLPAFERIARAVAGRPEPLRSFLTSEVEAQLTAIVRSGQGPRFAWLRGAIDADDVRQLVAPIVQQQLMQFASKLPIPGLGGGGGDGGGGLAGLVGRLGKQVQKSAGQLADVGRQMLGGVVRDFSQTATSEFRSAFDERVKSPEGRQILERMRDRMLSHVLATKLDDVVQDLMRLPRPEIARTVAGVLANAEKHSLFRSLLESELDALAAELGTRTVGELLGEVGELGALRARAIAALEPGVRTLMAAPAFEDWLERLLARAASVGP
jgi:hypothetical protein